MGFINFFHHLINPHCELCMAERREALQCENCDTLRSLLESEKFEKKELLNHLLGTNRVETSQVNMTVAEPIIPKNIPWRVRREMLESEDRAAAQIIRKKEEEARSQTTEELEKELGVG